jgi:hypothetical protein
MNELTADDIVDIESMRQRLGLKEDDTSRDAFILKKTPMERVRLLAGWHHGSESWADEWKETFEGQGLYLTTNPDADGVLHSA